MSTSDEATARVITTLIRLSLPIRLNEVPYLRGLFLKSSREAAIADGRGQCDVALHNHEGDSLRYAYPTVQYKCLDGNGAVIVLSHNEADVPDLAIPPDGEVHIGNRLGRLAFMGVMRTETEVGISDVKHRYKVADYLPFNQENYERYARETSFVRRMEMVERCLAGNMLSLCKGLGIWLTDRVEVKLIDLNALKPVMHKGVRMERFDAEFETNMALPPLAGLGKGVSHGFGTLFNIEIQ